jgi:lysophospholipase L1-like esterase
MSEPIPTPTPSPTQDDAPPRRLSRFTTRAKILFALSLIVVPILGLEAGLRLFAGWPTNRIRTVSKLTNFDPESFEGAIGMFRPSASSRVSWPPELAYEVRINSLGLRGAECSLEPAPDAFRILCLGDSTTFGFYVDGDETLPVQLQRYLHGRGKPQVETINGGCGGWSIASQSPFFIERASKLQPHLVVLTFCSNDISDLTRPRSNYESQKAQLGQGRGPLKRALYATAIYELALRAKIAWKRARQKASGEEPHPLSAVGIPEGQLEELWTKYEKWFGELVAFARQRKIPLAVAYLPDAYMLENKIKPDDEARLRALCKKHGTPFVSAQERFAARPMSDLYHVPLDPHQNAVGNSVLAEVTGSFLLERGLIH